MKDRFELCPDCTIFNKTGKYKMMLFESALKGKVIISIQLMEDKISSHIQRKGIAQENKYAIAAVLGTYISMCREAGRDPRKILEDNLLQLEEIIASQRDEES